MADVAETPPNRGGVTDLSEARRTRRHIDPALKAAVVFSTLGEEAAKPIAERLDDAALARISAALDLVAKMPREELSSIVVDVIGEMRSDSQLFPGGRAKVRNAIKSISEARLANPRSAEGGATGAQTPTAQEGSAPSSATEPAAQTSDQIWKQIAERKPEQIAEYLNGLTPNLISIVLAKLDTTLVSELLIHLDDAKTERVLGYMVEGKEPDQEILEIVTEMIATEFLKAEVEEEEEDASHLSSIGEVLSLIPPEKRDRMVAFLKEKHEGKLNGIQKSLFTIEGLPDRLPRNSISVIIREMDAKDAVRLISTLTGAYAPVAEFLLANISSRLADQMKEDAEALGTLSPEEAEIVQREFLTHIMTLKRDGKVEMEPEAE
jgi:flagellar motor switch protein FliG